MDGRSFYPTQMAERDVSSKGMDLLRRSKQHWRFLQGDSPTRNLKCPV